MVYGIKNTCYYETSFSVRNRTKRISDKEDCRCPLREGQGRWFASLTYQP